MNGNVNLPSRGIVYGQLIHDCLELPRNRRRRDLPVILLLGTRGNGKTELLKEIHNRAGMRPRVWCDLGLGDLRPYEIVVRLVFGLSQKAGQFGKLDFPRVALGLLAIRIDADLHNPTLARKNLENILSEGRRSLVTKLRAVTESLARDLSAPPETRAGLGLALNGLGALWIKRSLRGRPLTWYRDAWGMQYPDPLHALLELNQLEAGGTQGGRDEVDAMLCRAFLADLRDAFTTGGRAKVRTGNCLALLDNADSRAGQAFLKVLVTERNRHARNRQAKDPRAQDRSEDCDPLVVVAAGRIWFPAFALDRCGTLPTRSPHRATYDDWANSRNSSPRSSLYPVALEDLDACEDSHEDHPELLAMTRLWQQVTNVANVARKLHELTYGHLHSSRLVLHAIAEAVERDGARNVDLRGLLDWPDPEDRKQTVAGGVVNRLLPNALNVLRNHLVTCAAARDVGRPWPFPWNPDEFCDADLWAVRVGLAAERRFALHPFLRRVLLHQLAQQNRWEAVHDRLRTYYQQEGNDRTLAAYHGLALKDLAPVVAYLSECFKAMSTAEWLRELHTVSAAPRRPGPTEQTPEEQAWELATSMDADGGEAQGVITELVCAMWISKDPLGDPDRILDVFIIHGLNRLADLAGPQAGVLLHEAQRYQRRGQRECWVRWPPAGCQN